MSALLIILIILTIIISIFLWSIIHEFSHLLVILFLSKVKSWNIKLYPHKYNKEFRFAGIYWRWKKVPNSFRIALIMLAPRVPDLIASALLIKSWHYILMIFLFGGVVDLFIGSLGVGKYSDTRQAASKFNINPWIIRIPGLIICALIVFKICLQLFL